VATRRYRPASHRRRFGSRRRHAGASRRRLTSALHRRRGQDALSGYDRGGVPTRPGWGHPLTRCLRLRAPAGLL